MEGNVDNHHDLSQDETDSATTTTSQVKGAISKGPENRNRGRTLSNEDGSQAHPHFTKSQAFSHCKTVGWNTGKTTTLHNFYCLKKMVF